MDKERLNELITDKIKLIRIENNYTQEKMAQILGLSKKTLVQIEKGRTKASWSTTVSVCALFKDSEILYNTLGDNPIILIETIAHNNYQSSKRKSLGGKLWWREIEKTNNFTLQQNLISNHYRVLDKDAYVLFSSFDKSEALIYLTNLKNKDAE